MTNPPHNALESAGARRLPPSRAEATAVAQTGSLLYRRLPIGRPKYAPESNTRLRRGNTSASLIASFWLILLILLSFGGVSSASAADQFTIDQGQIGAGGGWVSGGGFQVFGAMGGIGSGFIGGTSLETWRDSWFSLTDLSDPSAESTVWGDSADPDNDGRVNYLEYALGLDPVGGTDKSGAIAGSVTNLSGNAYAVLSFYRRTDDPALQVTVETSTDRVTWNSGSGVTVSNAAVTLSSSLEWDSFRDLTALGTTAPRFLRLHLTGDSDAYSEVWAATPVVVQGSGSASSKVTFFSGRGVRPVVQSGTVGSVSHTVLGDSNASWTNNQFSGRLWYVEFASGLQSDIVSSASNQTLTVANDLQGLVNPGDAYQIRPHVTLDFLFGSSDSAGLLGGANPSAADNVILHDPSSQQTRTYFYSTVSGFTGWYLSDYTASGSQVIAPGQGIMVRHRLTNDVTFYQVLPLKETPTAIGVQPGYNLVGTLQATLPVTLDNLGLRTGNDATGVKGGDNPSVADSVITLNSDGSTASYFYSTFTGFVGWYSFDFQPAGSTPISAGSAFFVLRRTGGAAFQWTVPAE